MPNQRIISGSSAIFGMGTGRDDAKPDARAKVNRPMPRPTGEAGNHAERPAGGDAQERYAGLRQNVPMHDEVVERGDRGRARQEQGLPSALAATRQMATTDQRRAPPVLLSPARSRLRGTGTADVGPSAPSLNHHGSRLPPPRRGSCPRVPRANGRVVRRWPDRARVADAGPAPDEVA